MNNAERCGDKERRRGTDAIERKCQQERHRRNTERAITDSGCHLRERTPRAIDEIMNVRRMGVQERRGVGAYLVSLKCSGRQALEQQGWVHPQDASPFLRQRVQRNRTNGAPSIEPFKHSVDRSESQPGDQFFGDPVRLRIERCRNHW